MITHTNNLDRTAEGAISNWPFTYESTLDTGDGVLLADSFLAISVNVDETTKLPCRFKGITSDGELIICDATGAVLCKGKVYAKTRTGDEYCSFFLYNQYNVLCGFICCKSDVTQRFYSLATFANGIHYFGTRAFILLPQCHVQSALGNVRSFGVHGRFTTANLTLACSTAGTREVIVPVEQPEISEEDEEEEAQEIEPETEIVDVRVGHNILPFSVTKDGVSSISISVFNIEEPEKNKWCRVVVNGTVYNVENSHLIIKAFPTSNLRVVEEDAAIILRGVQDAQ